MKPSFKPSGAWTALVTPFDSDGRFDAGAYTRLLEFQLTEGVQGLVPCGTTGESPTLRWEEHGAAVALAVRLAQGRAGVLAGAGSNCTREAIDGTRDAWSRGASAVLLVDCYYNGPSSLELRTEYYERVLEAVPEVALVPYVIPGRTGCALSPEDLAMLHGATPDRVPAVKSASGDMLRFRRERELAGPGLNILSGDDDLTLGMMQDPLIDAAGVISVMSNIAPRAVAEMCAAQREGRTTRAAELAEALAPLFAIGTCSVESVRALPGGRQVNITDRFRNPVPVKTMMAGLGMLSPSFRAPLGKMTASGVERCRRTLREVFTNNPQVLTPIEEAFEVSVAARLGDDGVWSALAR